MLAAASGMDAARFELLAGDPSEAERVLRADLEFLQACGETYFLSTMSALLAQVLLEQGRDAEALDLTDAAKAMAAEDDIDTQVLWRSVRAPILAAQGRPDDAIELARAAVVLSLATDGPSCKATAHAALASVYSKLGRPADARSAIDEAITYYRQKEERVSLERAIRFAQSL